MAFIIKDEEIKTTLNLTPTEWKFLRDGLGVAADEEASREREKLYYELIKKIKHQLVQQGHHLF